MDGTYMCFAVLMACCSAGLCNLMYPGDPARHQRLGYLRQQAQRNINTGPQPRHPFSDGTQQSYNTRDRLLTQYMRRLMNVYLRYQISRKQRGGNQVRFDGRDRTVRTAFGSITYDGGDISYEFY